MEDQAKATKLRVDKQVHDECQKFGVFDRGSVKGSDTSCISAQDSLISEFRKTTLGFKMLT